MIRAEDISLGRRIAALCFLLVAYFFYAWSWNTVDILRPYIMESLDLTLTQSGSLYTLQAIGAIIGAVVMGQVADKVGRRNALIITMIGYGGFLLSGLLVKSYVMLIGQRLGLGFFLGSMFPIAVGIYSGLFDKAVRGKIAGLVFAVYNAAVAALSFLSAATFRSNLDWSVLLWAGAVPVVLAIFAIFIIPDDRKTIPYGGPIDGPTTAESALPIAELFKPGVAKQTLLLALMTGLNFLAYQCFNGWGTTFLRDERNIPDTDVGDVWGWLLIGQLVGSLIWGWIGDRYGRRVVGWGFIGAAIIVPMYLFLDLNNTILFNHPWYLPLPDSPLKIIGVAYGIMLSASVVWGPWLSELYPPHLRSTAASIFNWGRVVSMLAPLVTGELAKIFPLPNIMAAASIAFVAAAIIWFRMPETVARRL
jgi:MFS family permease